MNNTPLVNVSNLSVHYRMSNHKLIGVNDVSLHIYKGETLSLVGESGCGKTTTGKAILRLIPMNGGSIFFGGQDISTLTRNQLRPYRTKMQMIFQDPYGSLNPSMKVKETLSEALNVRGNIVKKQEKQSRIEELLHQVSLESSFLNKYPAELSGGQRQRISIARALAVEPEFIFCDEPISALDVSHQFEVLQLLQKLQREQHIAYLFVSHDLSVVHSLSHRIAVMYAGRIVEIAPAKEIIQKPSHPYTQILWASIPLPDPISERSRPKVIMKKSLDIGNSHTAGCSFFAQCPRAESICKITPPPLIQLGEHHQVRCHFAESNS